MPLLPIQYIPSKAGISTTMGAVGVWGGPPGVVVSAAYFGIDAFYPGGWPGALENQGQLINANQQVVPNFNLYNDMPGGF